MWQAATGRGVEEALLLADDLGGHQELPLVLGRAVGQLEHDVEHDVLDDRAEAAGAGVLLLGHLGDLLEGFGGEFDVGAFHLEEPAVLLDQRVARLGHDLDQGIDVQRHQRADHRQPADELGDHAELEQVVGGHLVEQLAELLGVLLDLGLAAEPDRLAARRGGR